LSFQLQLVIRNFLLTVISHEVVDVTGDRALVAHYCRVIRASNEQFACLYLLAVVTETQLLCRVDHCYLLLSILLCVSLGLHTPWTLLEVLRNSALIHELDGIELGRVDVNIISELVQILQQTGWHPEARDAAARVHLQLIVPLTRRGWS